jgi:hypothetical protein
VDTTRVHDDDDTIDTHYAALGRLEALAVLKAPHGCMNGLVFIGHMAVDPETGEEAEIVEAVPCKRCAEESAGLSCSVPWRSPVSCPWLWPSW